MIDPHVHCRDWNQRESHNETIEHALRVAERAGLDAIFDMPNTDPPITTRDLVAKRLSDAETIPRIPVFYGLYVGVTSDASQIREAVKCYNEFFPRVVGLKMYAGHSVGNLALVTEEEQRLVYNTLAECNYKGILVVHCEKESLMKPELWNPSNPVSHSYARPPEAETASIEDQIKFALSVGFSARLHIAHVSTPKSVELVEEARKTPLSISCGVTPHHCMLSIESILDSDEPFMFKVNPPLRSRAYSEKMLEYLKQGKIDWIETDHAPHALKRKINPPYMSGFPGLPFVPHFLKFLKEKGFSQKKIANLTHYNAYGILGINIVAGNGYKSDPSMHAEYEVDVYKGVRKE